MGLSLDWNRFIYSIFNFIKYNHIKGEKTMVIVRVRDNENPERPIRRFMRKVEKEGIKKDLKKNAFYLKPGDKRRLKRRLAQKRRRKSIKRTRVK